MNSLDPDIIHNHIFPHILHTNPIMYTTKNHSILFPLFEYIIFKEKVLIDIYLRSIIKQNRYDGNSIKFVASSDSLEKTVKKIHPRFWGNMNSQSMMNYRRSGIVYKHNLRFICSSKTFIFDLTFHNSEKQPEDFSADNFDFFCDSLTFYFLEGVIAPAIGIRPIAFHNIPQ